MNTNQMYKKVAHAYFETILEFSLTSFSVSMGTKICMYAIFHITAHNLPHKKYNEKFNSAAVLLLLMLVCRTLKIFFPLPWYRSCSHGDGCQPHSDYCHADCYLQLFVPEEATYIILQNLLLHRL